MKSRISPSALTKGTWLLRQNKSNNREDAKRYKDHATDLLLIEEVTGDRVRYRRFDGKWKGDMPCLRHHTSRQKSTFEKRLFAIVDAPSPPRNGAPAAKPKPAAIVPPAEVDHMIAAIREEMRDCTHKICASIDALTVAWTGRRPEVSKLNGHARASVTQ